jgi:hypothetical protein
MWLGPALVWLASLVGAYAFAATACDLDRTRWPMALITVLAVAMVLVVMVALARRAPAHALAAAGDDAGPLHRRRFFTVLGLALGGQFLAVLLAQGMAVSVLPPCP